MLLPFTKTFGKFLHNFRNFENIAPFIVKHILSIVNTLMDICLLSLDSRHLLFFHTVQYIPVYHLFNQLELVSHVSNVWYFALFVMRIAQAITGMDGCECVAAALQEF